jgi:uncharacterized protein (DUF1501 family)
MTIDRRMFLTHAGATLVAGDILCDLIHPREAQAFQPHMFSGPLSLGTPILVWIDLAGGNDTLNTVVPYNVPSATGIYLQDRPSLGVRGVITARPYGPPPVGNYLPPALDLDGHFGLHGYLPWLANRWFSRGDVAIVQGVGENVAKEFSHFAAMAYRAAGAFSGPNLSSGWLGRYNDIDNLGQPVASVSLAGVSPSLLGNATPVLGVTDVVGFDWQIAGNVPSRNVFLTNLAGMGSASPPVEFNKVAAAKRAIQNTSAAITALAGVAQPALNGNTQRGTLAYQLMQAAMMILGGAPSQTYVATLGGFDTHGGQAYYHATQLAAVDAALQSFFALIDASPRANDVFVVLSTEFGRQVKENAGVGTDHGRASSAILLGGGVRGGMYGALPSLTLRDFDALIPTVDFRDLYATVLNRLSGDPSITAAVLGKDEANSDFEDLDLFV